MKMEEPKDSQEEFKKVHKAHRRAFNKTSYSLIGAIGFIVFGFVLGNIFPGTYWWVIPQAIAAICLILAHQGRKQYVAESDKLRDLAKSE